MSADELKVYSVAEVAEMFKVTPETIRRWIRELGRFPHAKRIGVGRSGGYRIPHRDVVDFMEEPA